MARGALRIAAALVLLLLAWARGAAAADAKDPFEALAVLRPATKSPAPDIAFRSLDGREVRLREFRGKPVLLGFFTTW